MTTISNNQQRFNRLNTLAKRYFAFLPLLGATLNFAWVPLASAQDEGCPTQGVIKYPCYAAKATLSNITILERVSISGANLQGTIENRGWVANSTIQSGATLSGGILTGYITNEGTITDIDFRGGLLKGGTLAGNIINNSRVRGSLTDVKLAPNTYVRGGEMAGHIEGDLQAPALLENVRIRAGSHLSGVVMGQNVIVEEGVTIEESVIDEPRDELADLGIAVATTAQGDALTVNSYFWGGVATGTEKFKQSVKQKLTNDIKMVGNITVAPEHVGQTAELVVYATYQPATFPVKIRFMLNSEGKIVGWKGNMARLEAFKEGVVLEATQLVEIYQGTLNQFIDAAGTVEVYFGYRLNDGTVVASYTPLKIVATK
jgi:hypothetical protein